MVKNFLKNSRQLLFSRQTDILSAASIIAATMMLSRILGLLKYRLLNDRFNVEDIGLFFAAFRLPNTIFEIVVMGALTTAFIPVFASFLDKNQEEEANRVASTILNVTAVVLGGVALVILFLAEPLVRLITPGLSGPEVALVASFTRIMIIGQVIPLGLGNFLTGVLQSHKRFLIPALAPVLYNVGIILGIVLLSPTLGLVGAVWGVVLGACLFLLVQIPFAVGVGFRFHFSFNLHHPAVKSISSLTIPRVFGLAVNQLNLTANLALASLLSSRAITIFNYAQQLQQLPISLFGATIAQAALPTLSVEQAKHDMASFTKTFLNSFLQILFLTLPAAAVLIVLRIPIVRLVYGASQFDWPATVDTGRTLAFLGLSLVSESLVNLLVRSFFALKNSKTPVALGAVSTLINVCLAVLFIVYLHFPIWALAAAVAASDVAYSLMLLLLLNRKLPLLGFKNFFLPAIKMITAAAIALFSLYIPMKLLDQLVFDTTRTVPLLMLTGTASIIGLSVYLFFTWVFDIEELGAFVGMFKRTAGVIFKADKAVSEIVIKSTEPISEAIQEKD